MKKDNDTLFQAGDTMKIAGVTRKMLRVYEESGLLTPFAKNENSGYRYYSADNITQIRLIRTLQAAGMSLKEIAEYLHEPNKIDVYLRRLRNLRAELDRSIQTIQIRATKQGDLTIHKTTLPQQVCFCHQYQCADVSEAKSKLRDTYIAAARTGMMSTLDRMFTVRTSQEVERLDLMCCIPMDCSYDGPERIEFAETQALCIYYRGPYEEMATAIRALMVHAKKKNIEITGPLRSIYLEGPPNHGEHASDYITQIAAPINE